MSEVKSKIEIETNHKKKRTKDYSYKFEDSNLNLTLNIDTPKHLKVWKEIFTIALADVEKDLAELFNTDDSLKK